MSRTFSVPPPHTYLILTPSWYLASWYEFCSAWSLPYSKLIKSIKLDSLVVEDWAELRVITKNLGEREDIHQDSERGYCCLVGILSQLVNRSLKCILHSKFLLIVEPKSTRYIVTHKRIIILRRKGARKRWILGLSTRLPLIQLCSDSDYLFLQNSVA